MFLVYVNGKLSDEYMKKENAEAHADMARKLGNSAEVKQQQTFGEAEDEFNADAAKTGGMPYGTYGGYD